MIMKKKHLISVLMIFVLLLMSGCNGNSDVVSNEDTKALFKEGTYTAESEGNHGPMKIEVTLTATEIKDIKILSNTETAGLADAAFEKIKNSILTDQTLAVDAVAGATYSSNAILAAIEDCVKQAGGDIEALKSK